MRRLATLLAALALSGAPAAMAEQGRTDAAKVESGTYKVDPNHTQVLFGVSHFGFTTYYGTFTSTAGTLMLDPAKPAESKVDIAVKTGSVSVMSPKLQDELKSAQWLDASQFPEATFKSTKVTKTGADTATLAGELTLHGVTKPVTLQVTYVNAGPNPLSKAYTVGFEAKGKINRSDFGVKTYAPMIGEQVDLTISGAFERQG
ncbi:MAG: YceI family protein [Actinomycetospora chiangmaiensis]|nr:YceI family protein [Actinomycetospora chiangmaiensis]